MHISMPTMDVMAQQMNRQKMKARMNPKDPTVASIWLAVFSFISCLWGHDWSAFLTAVFALRMLASVQLAVFVRNHESVEGISGCSLWLSASSCAFRLSSHVWLTGYLPTDTVGNNYMCALMDVISLVCTVFVLYQTRYGSAKSTFMGDKDTMRFDITFLFCCVLAVLIHGDLDDMPVFDTFFYIGLYAGSLAPAPQLWMMRKDQFARQYLTWNYILPTVACVVASVLFWMYAYVELAPLECEDNTWKCFNWVGYATLGAHLVQAVLVVVLAVKNAPIVFRIDSQEEEFSLHIAIPTVPAAGGPASQATV